MNKIAQHFSNASTHYDELTDIQLDIGNRLAHRVQGVGDFKSVLDVGTGTGRVACEVQESFPYASIVGIDIARGMLLAANQQHHIKYIQADAASLPFPDNHFDLIVSGSAYQWVDHLGKSFVEARRCLKPEGVFAIAMFGAKTFWEMFECFDGIDFKRLPQLTDVTQALEEAKLNDHVRTELKTVKFKDLWSLLKWIKSIGANNLESSSYIGKDAIKRADEIYRQKYPMNDGIQVTFEVIWAIAKK